MPGTFAAAKLQEAPGSAAAKLVAHDVLCCALLVATPEPTAGDAGDARIATAWSQRALGGGWVSAPL
jgi:hypothetical protein